MHVRAQTHIHNVYMVHSPTHTLKYDHSGGHHVITSCDATHLASESSPTFEEQPLIRSTSIIRSDLELNKGSVLFSGLSLCQGFVQ